MSAIKAEWQRLRTVMVHEPGIEMFYGILDPESFLYMRRFDFSKAVEEHRRMQGTLREMGVRVHKLKDVIVERAKNDKPFFHELSSEALNYIRFEGEGDLEGEAREFKRDVERLDPETIFNVILLKPTVLTHKALGTGESTPRVINEEPLANLYFTRDQAIVTDRGIVIGRMSKRIRARETTLVKLALKGLSERVIKEVTEPAFAEGGDYMPFGDFAVFGVGDRTSIAGAFQVAEATGFNEIAVVYNPSVHENDYMLSMHLDMYLNAPMEGVVVSNRKTLEMATTEVFELGERGYVMKRRTNLLEFFKEKGFRLVEVSLLEQIAYSTNFLTVDNGRILALDSEVNSKNVMSYLERRGYAKLLEEVKGEYSRLKVDNSFFPRKREVRELGIDYVVTDVGEITGGFGGIHCMTMALHRG